MAIGLLGRKVGMTQIFDEAGTVIPGDGDRGRSLPRAAASHEGARRLRSGAGRLSRQAPPSGQSQSAWSCCQARQQALKRPKSGVELLPKADCEPKRFVREFRGTRSQSARSSVGQELDVDLFAEVKAVDVTGTSKGRGTAGVMKRHNFKASGPPTA